MDDFLEYTDRGLLNRVMFFSSVNQINIFVEDKNKEYEYQNIFQRLFNDEIGIKKIFAMGGKIGVIEAYKEYGDVYDNRKNVYLVDGDFDFLLGKKLLIRQISYI